MTLAEIVSYTVAALLAVSRILNTTKPLWSFLPTQVAMFLPPIVALIPKFAAMFGAVQTKMDLVNAILAAVMLALPGAGVPHPDSTVLPPSPPPAPIPEA